ncbi:hypothetical protein FQN52_000360 [Onygenales sp. PD_12]|nr:hypothetical protein FQN52_000360 [Onygenales sp. PD_12]
MDTGKGKYSDIIAKNRPNFATDGNFDGILDQNDPDLNLSTAEYVAKKLTDLGVSSIYEDATHHEKDYVLAIMRNGDGKTVFIRGMIQSSPSNQERELGAWICGHDTAALLAAIHTLVSAKSHWSGNLVVLFQPGELDDVELQDIIDTTRQNLLVTEKMVPDFIFAHHVCAAKSGLVAIQEGPAITVCNQVEVTASAESKLSTNPLSHIDSRITTKIPEQIKASFPWDIVITTSKINRRLEGVNTVLRFEIRTQFTRIGVCRLVLTRLEGFIDQEYMGCSIDIKKNPTLEKNSSSPSVRGPFRQAFSEHFGTDLSYAESTSYPGDFYGLQEAFPAAYAYWHVGGLTPGKNTAEEVQSTLTTAADAMALAVLSVLGCNKKDGARVEAEQDSAEGDSTKVS